MMKLISAFVFAIRIVQSLTLYYLNPIYQASSHLLWLLYSPVCVGPGRNPEDRSSHNEAHIVKMGFTGVYILFLFLL